METNQYTLHRQLNEAMAKMDESATQSTTAFEQENLDLANAKLKDFRKYRGMAITLSAQLAAALNMASMQGQGY